MSGTHGSTGKKRVSAAVTVAACVTLGLAVPHAAGADTARVACAPAWSQSTVYTGGDQASYGGHNWTAKWWTRGQEPDESYVWVDDGACGTTGVPQAPGGLRVAGTTATTVTLSWRGVAGADSYTVYEGAGAVGSGITGTSYTVKGLQPDTGYTFTVAAVDGVGESPHSTSVRARTGSTGGGGGGTVSEVAPYVDMTNSQEPMLDRAAGIGLRSYTAAFVIGEGCGQIWGDTLPVGDDPNVAGKIDRARSEGAEPIISTGGVAGRPLAWTCDDQGAIVDGYQKILDTYDVHWLDFDIEGSAVADTAAIHRNMLALKALRESDPGLKVSVTLPVLPSGLTRGGLGVVRGAEKVGLHLDVVNVMAMDYYQGNQDMGQAAIDAAEATLRQIRQIDPSYGYDNIGVTPMIGVNDDGSVFSQQDARQLVGWAHSVGLGRLAFWSVDRDQPCGGAAAVGTVTPAASSTCSGVSQQPLDFTGVFLS